MNGSGAFSGRPEEASLAAAGWHFHETRLGARFAVRSTRVKPFLSMFRSVPPSTMIELDFTVGLGALPARGELALLRFYQKYLAGLPLVWHRRLVRHLELSLSGSGFGETFRQSFRVCTADADGFCLRVVDLIANRHSIWMRGDPRSDRKVLDTELRRTVRSILFPPRRRSPLA